MNKEMRIIRTAWLAIGIFGLIACGVVLIDLWQHDQARAVPLTISCCVTMTIGYIAGRKGWL